MDIERINTVLAKAIVGLQGEEIDDMAEAMAGSYEVPTPGKVMGTETPGPMSMWAGQDWYYRLVFSDETLYFRPVSFLKNGNLKGFVVRVEYGRRGARKAVQQSVNKMDFGRWKPTPRKDLEKAAQKRFREKL